MYKDAHLYTDMYKDAHLHTDKHAVLHIKKNPPEHYIYKQCSRIFRQSCLSCCNTHITLCISAIFVFRITKPAKSFYTFFAESLIIASF